MCVRQATSVLITTTLLAAPLQGRAAALTCEQVFQETLAEAPRAPGLLASLFKSAFGRETPEQAEAREKEATKLRQQRDHEIDSVLVAFRANYRRTAFERDSLYRQRDRINARLGTVNRELERKGTSLFDFSEERTSFLEERKRLERELATVNTKIGEVDRASGEDVRWAEDQIRQAARRAKSSIGIDAMDIVSRARTDEQKVMAEERQASKYAVTDSVRSGRLAQALRTMTPEELEADRVRRETEREESEARAAEESRKRAEAEAQRRADEKEKADGVRGLLSREVPGYESAKVALVDRIGAKWLERKVMGKNAVYIAIGHHETTLSEPLKQIVTELVAHLTHEGLPIIYDADTVVGPLIQSLSETAIGVSGKAAKQSNSRVVSIVNPFLRMQTLLKASDVILTPDSVSGVGLLVEGHDNAAVKFRVLDLFQDYRWTPGLSDWASSAFREKPAPSYIYGGGPSFASTPRNQQPLTGSYWGDWGSESDAQARRAPPKAAAAGGASNSVVPSVPPKSDEPKAATSETTKKSSWFGWLASDEAPAEPAKTETVANAPESQTPVTKNEEVPEQRPNTAEGVENALKKRARQQRRPREERVVAPEKPENLGLSYSAGKAPIRSSLESLFASLKGGYFASKARPASFDALKEAQEMSDAELLSLYAQATHYARVINQLRTNHAESEAYGGAVVFGSAKGSPVFESVVYESVAAVAKRGSAIRHGGAGGFMATAGKAALENGGVSIGIPISGRHALENEIGKGADARGLTVETSGYEERIPALLEKVPLVMIAPGGGGTMKEIAVTLLSEAATSGEHRWIVFVGGSYYQGLETFLKSLPLSHELTSRLRVVSSATDMEKVLDEMKEQDPEAYKRLAQGN